MSDSFEHPSLGLLQDQSLVYTALSKHLFYLRMQISKFVLEQGSVPLNPFMLFDYYLADTVERDRVREANNNLVKRSDELWVFGPISDGVLSEIKLANHMDKTVRFFECVNDDFRELDKRNVQFEDGLDAYRSLL